MKGRFSEEFVFNFFEYGHRKGLNLVHKIECVFNFIRNVNFNKKLKKNYFKKIHK